MNLRVVGEVFEVEYVTYSKMCFGEVFEVEPALYHYLYIGATLAPCEDIGGCKYRNFDIKNRLFIQRRP